MKCITHTDIDAVATCARCSVGICPNCVNNTFYQIDNKPLCKKCNYEVGLENDRVFKSFLKSKQIKMIIFLVTFGVGSVLFFITKASGHSTFSSVSYMLLSWGLGFIGNFFDKTPDNRSVKAQAKDALLEIKYPVSSLVGKILGFFIMAVTSPIQILALWIGINRVKKQISENANVLNRFVAENT
jgi:hypothetical protein